MTDAKAIRNSVEGRDPFTDPADAIGRLRASSQRGPSATELHKRATESKTTALRSYTVADWFRDYAKRNPEDS